MIPINDCKTEHNLEIDEYMTISNIQGQIFYNIDSYPFTCDCRCHH